MCEPKERTRRRARACPQSHSSASCRGGEEVSSRTTTHASQVWHVQNEDEPNRQTRRRHHLDVRNHLVRLVRRVQYVEDCRDRLIRRRSSHSTRSQHHNLITKASPRSCLRESKPRSLPSHRQTRRGTSPIPPTKGRHIDILAHAPQLRPIVVASNSRPPPIRVTRPAHVADSPSSKLSDPDHEQDTHGSW